VCYLVDFQEMGIKFHWMTLVDVAQSAQRSTASVTVNLHTSGMCSTINHW
jgi:hypothetical protein